MSLKSLTKKQAYFQKRKQLAAISRAAKMLVKEGAFDSVNQALLDVYSDGEDLEFNSFNGWKEKGFVVKKGEKAFLIWGKPTKAQKKAAENDDEDNEFRYFPLAYVFSEKQVEPLNTKKS